MPNYKENLIAELEDFEAHLKEKTKSGPVRWAYAPILEQTQKQLALAKLGIHRIADNVCNCGLIVERSIKHGHRDHKTKHQVREFSLVIDF